MISGSFIVTILSAVVATPIAIGAAVFMTEISPKRGAKILQPVIELLVGIPSVVYGFIGLQVVVPFVRSILEVQVLVSCQGYLYFVMILPTVTFMTVDSLRAVPRHYREASLAMGATRWQTIWRVILNAAKPGIFYSSYLWYGACLW